MSTRSEPSAPIVGAVASLVLAMVGAGLLLAESGLRLAGPDELSGLLLIGGWVASAWAAVVAGGILAAVVVGARSGRAVRPLEWAAPLATLGVIAALFLAASPFGAGAGVG